MQILKSILLFVCFLPAFFLSAQDLPFVFGQTDPLDWERSQWEAYAGAPAVVLGSSGKLEFDYLQGEGWISTIDFPYAESRKLIFNLEVPEGWEVEFPVPEQIGLLGEAALFSYQASFNPDSRILRVIAEVDIRQTEYSPSDYAYLREFFQRVEDKKLEFVVLTPSP